MKKIFIDWIKSYSAQDVISIDGNILIETDYAEAHVDFYSLETEIVELKIVNKSDREIKFFLHFELSNLDHAKELFIEMIESLKNLKNKQIKKVLLCCSSGLTTNFFKEKLNSMENIPYEFNAVSYHGIYDKGFDYEIILIAPQISYLKKEIETVFKNKQIILIPPQIFASYDTFKLVELLINTKNAKKEKDKEKIAIKTNEKFGKYMVICIINDYLSKKITYIVYDECTEVKKGTILKEEYNLKDIEDLLDVVLITNPEIENVYISTPGMISEGKLTFISLKIDDVNITEMFERKYHRNFVVCNDANALARGYYEDNKDKLNNFVLYYIPLRNSIGGVGIIIDGKIYNGNKGVAGEVQFLKELISYSDDLYNLSLTIDGQIELTAKQMVVLITLLSPTEIGLYNPMITDINRLLNVIGKYIPLKYIPNIIKIEENVESMIWGAILLGKEELRKRKIEEEINNE